MLPLPRFLCLVAFASLLLPRCFCLAAPCPPKAAAAAAEKELAKERRAEADLRSYKTLFYEPGTSNKGNKATVDQSGAEEFEDDFM